MSKQIKKIIPYFLLALLILVGLFGSAGRVRASTANPTEPCDATSSNAPCIPGTINLNPNPTFTPITQPATGTCTLNGAIVSGATTLDKCASPGIFTPAGASTPPPQPSEFEKQVNQNLCVFAHPVDGTFTGCILQLSYGLFYQLTSFILVLAAYFFNILITITLSSTLFAKSTFIQTGWAVVRDLSNIFFILILLYIAIKIILGLGGSEVKKTIAQVIIMALLINFSMFFTEVIIDTSNVLALVFYNKLNTCTTVSINGQSGQGCAPYDDGTDPSKTGIVKKDVSGAMVNSFNPTNSLTWENFFKKARNPTDANGNPIGAELPNVPFGILMGLVIVAGAVMLFAAYCFFMSGLSFLGRLIELWVLIIAAPFAFMSSTVPKLSGIERWGWEAWLKRVLTAAFMAPAFMFLLYLIFLLLKAPGIFGNLVTSNGTGLVGAIQTILLFVIPALVILTLLMKATKLAKEGSGKYTEDIIKGAKVVGGLALGAAGGAVLGGAAIAGRATVGKVGASVANSKWAKAWESHGWGGEYVRRGAAAVGSGSFDVRGVKIAGKTLASATGMNLGEAQKGGFTERRKAQVENRQKRAKELEVGEDEKLKQDLNGVERDLQELLRTNSHELEQLDKRIKVARENSNDLASKSKLAGASQADKDAATEAAQKLAELKAHKKAIKNATDFTPTALTATATHPAGTPLAYSTTNRINGHSINDFEDDVIPETRNKIETENRRRRWRYAQTTQSGLGQFKSFVFSGGQHSFRGAREAAHNIRMEAKLDSGKTEGSH